jgi:hypothetical protein
VAAAGQADAFWLYFGDLYGTRGFTAADRGAPLQTSRRRSGLAVQASPSDLHETLLDSAGPFHFNLPAQVQEALAHRRGQVLAAHTRDSR